MKRWLVILVIVLVTLVVTNLLYSWSGSDQRMEVYLRFPPSADNCLDDTDILAMPIKVGMGMWNPLNGVDYGMLYLLADNNGNLVVDTDEWNDRTTIVTIEDINQDTPFVVGWLDSTRLDSGKHYFIIAVGKSLSGVFSCDITKIIGTGVNGGGDSTITDSAIRRFKAYGGRP